MLSHRNVIANVEGIAQVFWLTPNDVMIGVLPFFHSFGFTGTLWLPLVHGFGAVFHPNPMDAKTVGELAEQVPRRRFSSARRRSMQAYIRKCEPRAVRARCATRWSARRSCASRSRAAFQEKFGIDAARRLRLHGDGAGRRRQRPRRRTSTANSSAGHRPGSVGHPLPGVVGEGRRPGDRRGTAASAGTGCCW